MYSKSSWGGAVDPFILVTFLNQGDGDTPVSMVIYEYGDKEHIGRPIGDDPYPVRSSLEYCRGKYMLTGFRGSIFVTKMPSRTSIATQLNSENSSSSLTRINRTISSSL